MLLLSCPLFSLLTQNFARGECAQTEDQKIVVNCTLKTPLKNTLVKAPIFLNGKEKLPQCTALTLLTKYVGMPLAVTVGKNLSLSCRVLYSSNFCI